jgi:hypothetical protein
MDHSAIRMPSIGEVSVLASGAYADPICQAESTKRIAERLREAYAATDWKLDPNKGALRVRYYSELLVQRALDLQDDTTVREQLAREMLYNGDSASAGQGEPNHDLDKAWICEIAVADSLGSESGGSIEAGAAGAAATGSDGGLAAGLRREAAQGSIAALAGCRYAAWVQLC